MSNKIMLYSLKTGAFLARIVPRNIGIKIAYCLGYAAGIFPFKLRKRIERIQLVLTPNLDKQEIRTRAAQVVASYAAYWWDVFWLSSKRKKSAIDNIISVEGISYFEEVKSKAKESETGIIVVLPHMGSWEMAGAWISQKGFPPVVVAERLNPPELFDLFTKTRTQAGMIVIAHDDKPTSKLIKALDENKMICLVADRDISRKGVEVNFFEKTKTLPAGPAALALKTSAPILPICTYLSYDGSITLHFEAPIVAKDAGGELKSVEDITDEISVVFEKMIGRDPSQWHVLKYEWNDK